MLLLVLAAHAEPEMIPLEVFQAAKADPTVSDFELPLRDGGTFKLKDHHQKPVVLSFWASWCSPCRNELPALSEWAKAHPQYDVVAVNVDRERGPAEKFLSQVQVALPIAFDADGKALGSYGVTSMPTMFVIDTKSKLAFTHVGFSKEKGFDELDEALKGIK